MTRYETKQDAVQAWVREMNAYPIDMIYSLIEADIDSWEEITEPTLGSKVYLLRYGERGKIIADNGDGTFKAKLDKPIGGETTMDVVPDDVTLMFDDILPEWGTMWSFGNSSDDEWVEEGGVETMSSLGFRVFRHQEWGIFFGIEGAGYDFYNVHWAPLYEKRGLKWHENA